jgi:hypothetical protein
MLGYAKPPPNLQLVSILQKFNVGWVKTHEMYQSLTNNLLCVVTQRLDISDDLKVWFNNHKCWVTQSLHPTYNYHLPVRV